ncbi:MAG: YidC/Oxa1 family membrane protein insertase [Patescibacteria group bacterium]
MSGLWNSFLYYPLLNGLVALYHLFGNLGWAIIGLTVIIRLVLLPLTLPGLKAAQKMKELAPKLAKLKDKYKDDKQGLAKAQMDLYRSVGVSPWGSILPQIVQIIILIAMFQAFRNVLGGNGMMDKLNEILYSPLKFEPGTVLNLRFWYLELTQPDRMPWGINIAGKSLPGLFLIASAVAQFLSAKMMMPTAKKQEKLADKTPEKKDDFASMMQTQSLYIFPLMTIFIGLSFPSGLVLYWLVFSLSTLAQYLIINKLQKNGQR